MARPKSRSNRKFLLFSFDTTLGWSVIRQVSLLFGERKVDEGVWRRVNNEQGIHIGYQLAAAEKYENDSRSSPTYISASEMAMYAGRAFSGGKSRTVFMTEQQRSQRRGKFDKILPVEDAVERITGKVESWPFPASRIEPNESAAYGDRAVRVYPHA